MEWFQAAFRLILIGIGILILSIVYIALIIRIYRLLQVKVARDHKIKLTNQGNVLSVFQLKVESPDPRLDFKLFYKDMPLIEIPETSIPEPTPGGYPVPAGSGKSPPTAGSSLDIAQTAGAGREIASKVGIIASFLGTIGNIIPGSLGNQLRSKGGAVRGVQTGTLKTTQAPLRTQQKFTALKMGGSRLTGAGTGGGSTARGHQNTVDYVQTAGKTPSGPEPGKTKPGQPGSEYWAQTKEVDPGESLSLTLRIDSRKRRYPEGSFLYILHSQQVSLEPANVQIPPVTSRGTVHFKPITAWRYWLPIIVCGLVVVLTFFSLSYYLRLY